MQSSDNSTWAQDEVFDTPLEEFFSDLDKSNQDRTKRTEEAKKNNPRFWHGVTLRCHREELEKTWTSQKQVQEYLKNRDMWDAHDVQTLQEENEKLRSDLMERDAIIDELRKQIDEDDEEKMMFEKKQNRLEAEIKRHVQIERARQQEMQAMQSERETWKAEEVSAIHLKIKKLGEDFLIVNGICEDLEKEFDRITLENTLLTVEAFEFDGISVNASRSLTYSGFDLLLQLATYVKSMQCKKLQEYWNDLAAVHARAKKLEEKTGEKVGSINSFFQADPEKRQQGGVIRIRTQKRSARQNAPFLRVDE